MIATVCVVSCDIILARLRVGLSAFLWLKQIVLPLMLSMMASTCVGYVSISCLEPSLWRVVVTTAVSVSLFLILSWFFVLDMREKDIVILKILAAKTRLNSIRSY